MTGMPASIALVATSVSAAPSVGSSTIASTLSLMNVSIWLICRLASLVPSAAFSSTSSYFFASARAELLIAASQPWSAAGPEKPITTFFPGSSLFDVAPESALLLVPLGTRAAAFAGLAGFDTSRRVFDFLPADADFFLLAAFVAYSGCGGMMNITLSNWARDKGYGMGQRAGYIPAAVGGQKIQLAATGFIFTPDAHALSQWRGWWRIVRADQWGVFFVGAIAGMILPAVLYVTFLPAGADIRGLGISAALASSIGAREGALLAGAIAVLGAWLLFKTQLDLTEALVRAITDILWTGSRRVRAWRGGDVRLVYYTVLVLAALWGIIALRLAQPVILLQIAANVAGFVFVVATLHLLYINTRFLPPAIRPSRARCAVLVAMSLFYGFFVFHSIRSVVG